MIHNIQTQYETYIIISDSDRFVSNEMGDGYSIVWTDDFKIAKKFHTPQDAEWYIEEWFGSFEPRSFVIKVRIDHSLTVLEYV